MWIAKVGLVKPKFGSISSAEPQEAGGDCGRARGFSAAVIEVHFNDKRPWRMVERGRRVQTARLIQSGVTDLVGFLKYLAGAFPPN